jgi:hypothetical protein
MSMMSANRRATRTVQYKVRECMCARKVVQPHPNENIDADNSYQQYFSNIVSQYAVKKTANLLYRP